MKKSELIIPPFPPSRILNEAVSNEIVPVPLFQDLMRDRKRLTFLVKQFGGVKWSDSGPLIEFKPDDEKYITETRLLEIIDKNLW